jgi:hypothetical protein
MRCGEPESVQLESVSCDLEEVNPLSLATFNTISDPTKLPKEFSCDEYPFASSLQGQSPAFKAVTRKQFLFNYEPSCIFTSLPTFRVCTVQTELR